MLKDHSHQFLASHQDTSSSPTILTTEHQNQRGQNQRGENQCGGSRGGGRNQRGGGSGGRNGGSRGGRQSRGDAGVFSRSPNNWGKGASYPWSTTQSQQHQRGLLPHPPTHQAQWTNTANSSFPQHWLNLNPVQPNSMFFLSMAQQPNNWQWFQCPNNMDQPTTLPQAFNSMTLQDPGNTDWYMDTGETAHLHANSGFSHQTHPPSM
ncbi:unnamed protein product [Lactuca virosa]|uniref:Uncharacterized protein n=1 Tax=Lactuca virosa TaxID=75947 RepID=A0AAU9MLZ0_9ASTR|nr:unnamed protein product [Lactuca virosa]